MSYGVQDNSCQPFDPFIQRDNHKLTTIYSLGWKCDYDSLDLSLLDSDWFYLGRLADFYQQNKNQFPKIINKRFSEEPSIEFSEDNEIDGINNLTTFLLCLPSDEVIVVDILSFKADLQKAILVMEDFYYHKLKVEGNPIYNYHKGLANKHITINDSYGFTYHQIFTINKEHITDEIDYDLVQKLIYRANLPYRKQYSSIEYPIEVNRTPNTFCGIGAYVTVNGGQQEYIENCIMLSAISLVGSVEKMKHIRHKVRDTLSSLKLKKYNKYDFKKKRSLINDLNKIAIRLKLELSLYVELISNISLLVPSLRVTSYHTSIYKANNMKNINEITSNMLKDLEKIIVYEKNRIKYYERTSDEANRRMWTVIISFISVISIPPSIILAFFSSRVQEVGSDSPSIFDLESYGGFYTTITLSIFLAIAIGMIIKQSSKPKE